MRITLVLPALLLSLSLSAQVRVSHLLTENLPDPLSVDSKSPRFSWQLSSTDRNELQTAYELQVGDRPGDNAVWNPGKVSSDQSVFVVYDGPALQAGKRYFWRVRVWDNKGRVSEWSKPAFWQMGMLAPADWKARWIQSSAKEEPSQPSPLLRTTFTAKSGIASATAYITAHGLYEAQLNGQRVGDAFLTPGWTSYNKRLQYQAYDVTGLVHPGRNAVGAMLGSGWYRGYICYDWQHNVYGSDVSLLFQLIIRYKNGRTDTVASDAGWKATAGEVRHSEIYDGETIDHRQEKKGWSLPDYDDTGWAGVDTANYPKDNLVATINEPIMKQETFHAGKLLTTPKGEKVIDFGQNLTGWVIVKVKGKAGDSIRLSHAEVLDKEGNFYTENLRRAKAQDFYILKGGEEEVFEPHFTFHGFRYIRIEGSIGEINPDDYTAVALYSAMPKTGEFS
ncbi:MAG TPA: family 78 glycoside hydrolase catalytic domain, partial [Puia sp.]|nr:family 78 glycoside hydrolase catalytic domain [Puia sp.]